MLHYNFTNDLRISTLEDSINQVAHMFLTNTVPSAEENKSANNNAMTLGFYFNLKNGTNCAKIASQGDTRKIVLNFIKKFQFPNLRTKSGFDDAKRDNMQFAPMRVILKLLYMVFLTDGESGYVSEDELKYFIFHNIDVATNRNANMLKVYEEIHEYRKNNQFPSNITDVEWNQEERQIREMLNVLTWSGCVVKNNSKYSIKPEELTNENKANIFDIITCNDFWEGETLEDYQRYMDISIDELETQNIKDEYDLAAEKIKDYIATNQYELEIDEEEIKEIVENFNDRFSPEALEKMNDEDLLYNMFGPQDNESMVYLIEFNPKIKDYFGSISGGSAYKFGLFKSKETNEWVSGSSQNPQKLSEDEAKQFAIEMRKLLIECGKLVKSSNLNSINDYIMLSNNFESILGKYSNLAWIHKYLCMVFYNKFCTWHSSDWQNHILLASGIRPLEQLYARSGQIALIAKKAKISVVNTAKILYKMYGNIREFYRIGTSSDTENYFEEWYKDNIVAIGWSEIGNLTDIVKNNNDKVLKKQYISDLLENLYYKNNKSLVTKKSKEICDFYNSTSNTVIVAMDGARILDLADNTGGYKFESERSFSHVRDVCWKGIHFDSASLPNKSENKLTTYSKINDTDNLLYLYEIYFNKSNIKEKKMVERKPRENKIHPLNQIIYGAPGTGKTYSTVEYALAIINNRPVNLERKSLEQRRQLMSEYNDLVNKGRIVFTTFHQSYGYEEFIQGFRPDLSATGSLAFDKKDGIFKSIAKNAYDDPEHEYVIIIDEINRGNISKIFGELITLIEEDKRYGEINQLTLTLPTGDEFTVPNNLYIIGTMNSADKSISFIDTALRRRFSFIEQSIQAEMIDDGELKKVFSLINEYLKKELRSTDLLIGHSFFMNKTVEDLDMIMNNNIIPLLYEYFYDDEVKVRHALECIKDTKFEIDNDYIGRIRIKIKG